MKILLIMMNFLFLFSCGVVKEENDCLIDGCGATVSSGSGTTTASKPTVSAPATNPYYSSGSSITVSGSCTDGATVNLSGPDPQSLTCSSSNFSFNISTTTDGAKTYSLTQTVSGSTSSASTFVWNRDTTNPSAPTISSPTLNPYNSSSASLVLTGSCEAGSTVTMNNGVENITYNCSTGTYSFSINKNTPADGTYNYTLTQTDRAGNTSSSTAFQWIINSSNPVPTITTPDANPFYSNLSSLSITGTCASGATVYLSGLGSSSTTCSGGAAYSFSASCSTTTTPCYNDGTYIFSIAQSSGTMSDAVSKTLIRDTLAPNPIIFSISNPLVAGGNTLSLIGSCEEAATVSLTTNAAINTNCSNGYFSLPISSSCSGSCDYTVKQTDRAGNSSPSTTFTWIYESTMPATPTITSPTSLITYNKASSFEITGTCAGSYNVILSGINSNNGTAITTSDVTGGSLKKSCSSGIFSFTVNRSSDGNYVFSVIQQIPETTGQSATPAIDSAAVLRTWVRDSVSPSAVTIINPTSPYELATPYRAGGSLYLSGNCEEYATVTLSGSSSATTTCTNGSFSFLVSPTTDNTTYNYSITQTDRASNTSTSTSIYWFKDNTIPEAPRILNPSFSPYNYNGTSITISGICTSGLEVTLSGADSQTIPSCTNGSFIFTSTKADGNYTYYVSQGTAPNKSPNSTFTWNKDSVGPTVTIGGSITEGSTNDEFTSTFTLSANETVQSYFCSLDGASYTPCVSPVTYDGLSNTTHSLSVKAIDLAGNWGSVITRNWTQSSNGTIALYHFNSDTTNSSNYGSSTDLTSTGVTYTTGKISNALSFTSGSSAVSVAHHSSLLKLNPRMTAEFWFKISSGFSNNKFTPIITKMGASGAMGWEIGVKALGSNDYIVFRGSNNGTTTQEVRSTSTKFSTGTWYHVAVTYNKGTVRFFLDGATKGSASVSGSVAADLYSPATGQPPLRIGKTDSSSTTQEFSGQLDEVRLSQIIRYSSSFTPSTSAFSAD